MLPFVYKRVLTVLVVCGLLIASAAAMAAQFTQYDINSQQQDKLADGVTLSEYKLSRLTPDGKKWRQLIRVVEMDAAVNPALAWTVGLPRGRVHSLRETSRMAEAFEKSGARLVAALNGDFFDVAWGGPLGACMKDGRWLCGGEFPQSYALGRTAEGSCKIAQPQLSLTLSAQRGSQALLEGVAISALNAARADIKPEKSAPANAYAARQDNTLVLYTPDYGPFTRTNDGGYEIVIAAQAALASNAQVTGQVVDIHNEATRTVPEGEAQCQGTPLAAGSMVLSAAGDGTDILKTLQIGDMVTITVSVRSDFADVTDAVGGGRPDGGPLLCYQGALVAEDTQVADYRGFYKPHARTAVGVRADGSCFFVVADAYLKGKYEGLTVAELAQIMLDLGAQDALNLDGGSSSTLVARLGKRLKVLNDSSGGRLGETSVGNSILIYLARHP